MKKLIALLLVLVMALSLAACGDNNNTNPTTTAPTQGNDEPTEGNDPTEPSEPVVTGPANSLELLNNVFAAYAEDQKPPVLGGSGDTANYDGGPGALGDLSAAEYQLHVSADQMANVVEGAHMMFAMNANSLTAGVLKVNGDVNAFVQALKESVINTEWMCGFPEQLVIYTMGEYVIMAFGLELDFIAPFVTALTTAYPDAVEAVNTLLY